MSDTTKTALSAGEIEELKALEAKATPGPWFSSDDVVYIEGNELLIKYADGRTVSGRKVATIDLAPTHEQDCATAALIAAMRNALPRLMSMLTPVEPQELAEAVEVIKSWRMDAEDEQWLLRTLLRAARAPRPTATPGLADAWHRILNTDASPDEFVRVSCDDVSTVLCALQNAYNGTAESVPRLTGEQREAQLLLSHATAGKEDFETVKVTAGVLRAAFAADLAGEVDRG